MASLFPKLKEVVKKVSTGEAGPSLTQANNESKQKNEKQIEQNGEESSKEAEKEILGDYPDDLVVINVGGSKHDTTLQTLKKVPHSRLYTLAFKAELSGQRYFYFDRHPDIFGFILNYYRIGKLHIPTNLCGPLVKEELDFWKIDDKDIQPCCFVHYAEYEETLQMMEKFEADDIHIRKAATLVSKQDHWWKRYKPKIWHGLQDPYSSKPAAIYAVVSLLVVITSILVFVLESLPYFGALTTKALDSTMNITSDMLRKELYIIPPQSPYHILLIIDNCCNLYFFIEFVIKLLAAPSKRRFLISPLTISEMVCLIPYYIAVAVVMLHPDPIKHFLVIRIMFALKVLRIFRIFIVMKHFLALKILIYTIKSSTTELFLLLLVVVIGVVIFACLEYYMEIFSSQDTQFEHIPLAFWWALITMTTVGYGDIAPSTGAGYFVGSICAISGVLVIALSVPAVVNNFTLYYTHARSRKKLQERKTQFGKEKWDKVFSGFKKSTALKSNFLELVNEAVKNSDVKNNINKDPEKESSASTSKDIKKQRVPSRKVAPLEIKTLPPLLNPNDCLATDRMNAPSPACSHLSVNTESTCVRRNSNYSALSFNDTEKLLFLDDQQKFFPKEDGDGLQFPVPQIPKTECSQDKTALKEDENVTQIDVPQIWKNESLQDHQKK